MEQIGTKQKTAAIYYGICTLSARDCSGCTLRGQCLKSMGNHVLEVNHKLNAYKKKAAELLTSEEGVRHRG